jgi:hypothetical protein
MHMKKKYTRVPTEFGPEIGFTLKPAAAKRRREDRFRKLKHELLFERLDEELGPKFNKRIRQAASEAEAIAFATPFPLLIFPALFEEKAADAAVRFERQERIYETSPEFLSV